jgi:raffinose/stachyose/melibiose transport system permease protein
MGLFRYTARTFSRELTLIAVAIVFCVPAYVVALLSLKSLPETYLAPLKFPTDFHLENYSQAWRQGGQLGMGHAMLSSIIITVSSVLLLIVIGAPCAYVIARRPSRLATTLYFLFVIGIILPFQLAIIPLFVILHRLHLTGTYFGMIVLYTGILIPLTVFLYAGFIRALPRDYEEAAEVDGAGQIRTFLRVVFPLLLPITGTVALMDGNFIWNDFFLSLIFLFGTSIATLPVALYSFVSESVSQWNLIASAVVISVAPMLIFYLAAQRHLIRGFEGGIKG